jgi:thiol-disulfide isomerase/thioredoxin
VPTVPPGPPPAPEIPFNQLVVRASPVAAPPVELPTADGKTFSLAAARGQVVVMNFWATWCPPCAKEMPSMVKLGQSLARKHPGKFKLVAVSVDEEPAAVKRFFAAPGYGGLPKDVVVAHEPGAGPVTRTYFCTGRGACRPEEVQFPETYVVDPSGRISAVVVGDIDWADPAVGRYLEALVKG